MVLSVSDEKGEVIAIVSSKEEADKLMKDHPKWTVRTVPRIWP